MHRSRTLVSLFLLTMLILTACQSGATPTPEAPTSQPPTDPPPTEPPPTSTLPPTAAPTETPAGITLESGQCLQLLENGDFETGSLEPWTATSSVNSMLIGNFHGRNGTGYHTVLGTNNGADESISQEFTVPVNAATVTLKYWWSMGFRGSDKTKVQDRLTVSLDDPTGQALETPAEYNNTTPVENNMIFYEASHDLSKHAGQTVRLTFHSVLDDKDRTDFFLDDVAVEACGPAAESASPTQTPAGAASPTAAALGKGECVELIQNGDFEAGLATPWIESGSNWPLVMEFPGRSHDKFSAFMGSTSNVNQSLSQLITIPTSAASATLTYWWNRASHEKDGTPHDFLTVSLRGPDDKDLATLEEINNTTGQNFEFYQSTKDLSPYIGKTVSLVFHVTTDAQNDSDFSVDDVSLQACGPK